MAPIQRTYENFGKVVSRRLQPILQETPVVRRLLVRSSESGRGIGHRRLETFGYETMDDATTDMNIRDDISDTYNIAGTSIEIPIQQAITKLGHRDLAAMRMSGIQLDTDMLAETGIKVALKLDDDVFNGWSTDGVTYRAPGIIQRAGLNVVGAPFSVYGNAIKSVASAMAMLTDANVVFPAFNLILNPVQYYQLLSSATDAGVPELPLVEQLLNSMSDSMSRIGRVVSINKVPEGEAYIMLAPISGADQFYSLLEAIDPMVEIFPDTNSSVSNMTIRVMSAGVFLCHYLDESTNTTRSIVKITGI
jgi:hypothetical protein